MTAIPNSANRKRWVALTLFATALIVLAVAIRFACRAPASNSTLPTTRLVAALRDQSMDPQAVSNRVSVCRELARRGPSAQEAVPDLIKALDDPAPKVMPAAVTALKSIGEVASNAAPALIQCMEAGRLLRGRDSVPEALIAIHPEDAGVIQALAKLLDGSNRALVAETCRVLTFIGTATTNVEAGLIKRVPSPDELIAVSAICGLGRRQKPSEAVVVALNGALSDPRPAVQEASVNALGELGAHAGSAVPALLALLEKSQSETMDAKQLLLKLNPPLNETRDNPALEFTSSSGRRAHQETELHYRTLRALDRIGASASAALPKLLGEAKDNANSLRFEAAVAALDIGTPCSELMPVFSTGCGDPQDDVRVVCLYELARVSARCPAAVEVFAKALSDASLPVRSTSLRFLSAMGTNALPALDAIKKARSDQKIAVRNAAKQLVDQLSH
jgi:HEAT repeat protein